MREPIIEVEGLVKMFRSGARALDGLSLRLPEGLQREIRSVHPHNVGGAGAATFSPKAAAA